MSGQVIDEEALKRAYAQLRQPGWPPLDEMRAAFLHFVAVKGLAASYSKQAALFCRPVVASAPAPQPPTKSLADALRHPPIQDGRSAAAGEYIHEGDA